MEIGGYDIFIPCHFPVGERTEPILFEIQKVWPEFYFHDHDSFDIFQPAASIENWKKACNSQCFMVYPNHEAVMKWEEDVQPDNTMLYILTSGDDNEITVVVGIKDEFATTLVENLKKVI